MNRGVLCSLLLLSIIILIFCIKRPYKPSELIKRLKSKLGMVNQDFINYDIRESVDGSFTEGKATVYICTRDPETKEYYSDNTLIYVCLHECAHMMDKTYNEKHDDKFKSIFKKLLNDAERVGIYDSKIPIPRTYCGL